MMSRNLVFVTILILAVIGFSLFILQNIPEKNSGEFTVGESRTVAENFIKNSPTYRFDGFDLMYAETITLRCPFCWEFVFEFQSRHAGYGDRTGKILLQVITEHKAGVVVDHGRVISAILDEKWDELNQKFLNGTQKETSLILGMDVYPVGEKVEFIFNPGIQKIYSENFGRWQIYKFEDNEWKSIPTGILFGCRPTDCIDGEIISRCIDPPMIGCREIPEPVSDSWNQKYWTTEKRTCGNQTYEFDVPSQVKSGKYKIRYNYATDSDCENYSYVEKEFMIDEEPTKEVTITTDKTEYETEETVTVIIRNNLNKPIWYIESCNEEPLDVFKYENGEWVQFHRFIVADCAVSAWIEKIEPNDTVEVRYDGFWNKVFDAGNKYRIGLLYSINKPESTADLWDEKLKDGINIYSNEFRIKEKQNGQECTRDSDCGTGGCSGQVCTTAEKAKEIITTCEFLPEYECLRLTTCGCVEGKCQWKENSAYRNCMDKLKSD